MKKTRNKSAKKRLRNKDNAQAIAQVKSVMNQVPVLIGLHDGSYYYGFVRDLQGQELLFEGVKGTKKLPKHLGKGKATISGLGGLGGLAGLFGNSGGLGGLFGGSGGAGAAGATGGAAAGSGGFGGLFGKIGGFMKFGMGMLKFIMPLMGGFGI